MRVCVREREREKEKERDRQRTLVVGEYIRKLSKLQKCIF